MTEVITLETFSENNRDRVIGNSLYRIIPNPKRRKWQVFEIYSNNSSYAQAYSDETFDELKEVIDYLNSLSKERELTKI